MKLHRRLEDAFARLLPSVGAFSHLVFTRHSVSDLTEDKFREIDTPLKLPRQLTFH
jgi:hypothetical protein